MKKSIYLLPNLFTTGNLLCGFSSVIASINEQYVQAALVILLAAVLDCLDGKVARMTNSASAFGVEYDSLADLLSFGLAPGLLLYSWILRPFGHFGWLAACLFVICGALRLARFNVQASGGPRSNFTGLPIPMAAGVIASAVLLGQHLYGNADSLDLEPPLSIVFAVYVLASLLVSNFKYRSFKYLRLRRVRPVPLVLGAALTVLVIALMPELSLFLMFFGYALSGPVESLVRRKKPKDEVITAEQ
ncbi:MAG: CDP-diacylglycerol--serine O-phosphatidyltransferase [Candidatus Tectomicrobia bacterium]